MFNTLIVATTEETEKSPFVFEFVVMTTKSPLKISV